jgi:hypothetical protein
MYMKKVVNMLCTKQGGGGGGGVSAGRTVLGRTSMGENECGSCACVRELYVDEIEEGGFHFSGIVH